MKRPNPPDHNRIDPFLYCSCSWPRRLDPALAGPPFPDKNLEAAIRDVLKHEPKVELTDEKLLDIYFLEAPGKEIKDLTGLEKCKNLALIKLTKNKISDSKPLKDLANLQSLDLAQNEIKDIIPAGRLQGSAIHRALRQQGRKDRRPQRSDRHELALPGQQRDQGHRPAGRLEQALDAFDPQEQDQGHLGPLQDHQALDDRPARQRDRRSRPPRPNKPSSSS